ncbi:hypothetical protein [Bifidobacterium felsineum]|uniref:hypothetical protein n=1 Tax=Bifidobacterium felsineum TaxID=2045440 RepID=UPI001BDDB461|nr:hypothetical protein [Bifidobacterium felsineum]MBT1163861.1 hypothetical protein [Bifidobacterium felsineum]
MFRRIRRLLALVLAALAIITAVECIVFNTPFWRTLGASTDTNAVHNALGSGLKRTDDGMLTVTDPTNAYLELTADGTSDFLRIDSVGRSVIAKAWKQADEQSRAQGDAAIPKPLTTVHVRVDITSQATQVTQTGKAQSIGISSSRSHYINASGSGVVRVWIQEERGAIVPISDARANVKVPFVFNWVRVAAMALILTLIALWRPGSKLWRITLNPASIKQRLAFAAIMLIPTVALGWSIIWQLLYSTPLAFHTAGNYTYDFDQYAHVADSLIAGRPWLDLQVPSQLAQVTHPYDVPTRLKLLSEGVSPIYWDYAFYDGHWYSYFGVLPAALLFAPYRLATGRVLPTGAAEQFLMLLFIIFFSMLLLRTIHRVMPKTSLAAASLVTISGLLGAQVGYLVYRTNFYQVPFAASLALTSLGLWFWLGADTSARPLLPADRWHAGDTAPLSLPRLAAGALCIAANFGCRPTFTLTALLAFPLFWPQIRAMVGDLRQHRVPLLKALRAPAAMIIPAIIVVTPLMLWNKARFGSLFNFGNAYQFTVSDMTRYTTPMADMPSTVWYYLFLPLRFTQQFPWLAISPAPMPVWGYYEVMVGALFTATPLMLLSLVLPYLSNLEMHGMRPWLVSCLALGAGLVVFDSAVGGLGWRYMADFGWLIALAAVPGTLWLINGREPSTSLAGANDAASGDGIAHVTPWRWLMRWTVLLLVLWALAIAVLSCFVLARDDAMIINNPGLWHDIQSWFSLL